jgi:hypothetical protein
MTTKETAPDTLGAALIRAQQAFTPIIKDNNVSTGKFSYKYADIGSVLEAVTDALHENGLVILQPLDIDNGVPVVKTILLHAGSGERIEGNALIVWADKTDPQKYGGGISYTRRYALMSMLGLNAEDDDGQSARQPAPVRETINQETGEITPHHPSSADEVGTATQTQRNRMFAIAKSDELGLTDAGIKAELMKRFKTESTRDLSFNQMTKYIKELDGRQNTARRIAAQERSTNEPPF